MAAIIDIATLAAPYVAIFSALIILWAANLRDDLIEHFEH